MKDMIHENATIDAALMPSFKEYLSRLPADIVFGHFLSRQGLARKILSSSSIDEIARRMSSEKSIRDRFVKLSAAGRYTCSCIYLFGKRGLEVQGVTGFDDELLGSFLVFAGNDETGKTFYFGFPEFEACLALPAAEMIIDRAKSSPPKEHPGVPRWLCLCDLTVLCICASGGQLRTTQKGTFTKASEIAMKRFLHASHGMATEEALLPRRLLFDYALARKLLLLDNDTYKPLSHNILEWMARPLAERYADFRDFSMSAAPLWSKPVIEALAAGPKRQWLSLPLSGETAGKDARVALACLRYIGMLDVIKNNGSLSFARPKTDEPQPPAGRIILLADFSAVLTREAQPEDLYWFSKAGSLESFDSVYKGTIRRQIINDSLSEGINENKLVEWLEAWKAPPNVLSTVKEWIREFSRMYITTHATIVSTDERAAGQLLSYEPLKRLIEPVRSQSLFRIRPGREQEVRRILLTMGFDPRMPGDSAAVERNLSGDAALHDLTGPDDPALTRRIVPVVSFGQHREQGSRPVKSGKYGQKLKELDMSDLFHVLDYAVLMGQSVTFEYRGSPLVKKGMYKVSPLIVQKSPEPFLDAFVLPKKTRKRFLLKCIIRLGVESA
jgi:hypothetical protein